VLTRESLEVGEGVPVFHVLVDEVELVESNFDGPEEQVLLEAVRVPDGSLERKFFE
jgi:hypothetical protein